MLLSICALFQFSEQSTHMIMIQDCCFHFHYFTASGGRLPSILRTNQTPRLYIRLLNLPRTEKITCSLLPSTLITSSLYMQPLGCFRQLVGRAFLRGRLGVTLPSEEQWLLFLKLLFLWCSHHFYYLQYNSWNMDLAMLDPSLICQTLVSYTTDQSLRLLSITDQLDSILPICYHHLSLMCQSLVSCARA